MTNETRLLAHLAARFPGRAEDLASESLAFVLTRLSAMRAEFEKLVGGWAAEVPAPTLFLGQSSQAIVAGDEGLLEGSAPNDGLLHARPDVIGLDAGGNEVVIIEAKFWAGLTAAQPTAYLDRLRRNVATPSMLMVVAPGRRLDSLWPELRERCLGRPMYAGWIEGPRTESSRTATVAPSVSVVLTTWAHILSALMLRASSDGDQALVSDIAQLQILALQQDDDAFLPLHPLELGRDIPRCLI